MKKKDDGNRKERNCQVERKKNEVEWRKKKERKYEFESKNNEGNRERKWRKKMWN